MNTTHAKNTVLVILLFVLAPLMQGCAGTVDGITLLPQSSVQRGYSLTAYIKGKGDCGRFRITWGDGSILDVNNINFPNNPALAATHTYDYWGGPKTVTVEGLTNCVGKVQARIVVEPRAYALAFYAPSTTACGIVPLVPAVRQNAIVTITTGPTKMDFGCSLGGCVYSADGELNSVAPSDYPFPGLRKYSLVIRLGSQVVQGSNRFTFTANQNGFMEVCANDNDLRSNSGAWGVHIEVDESGL